jgi:hypothetical protein
MKWCLVAAGLKDLGRPAEKLSINQNIGKSSHSAPCSSPFSSPYAALAATGFIWVRYSLVITPINYSLAAVCPIPPGASAGFSLGFRSISLLEPLAWFSCTEYGSEYPPDHGPTLLTFPVATAELCPHSQKLLEALLVFKHTSNK